MDSDVEVKVSVILLDWSVREHFQSLYFLRTQDVPRTQYELIWVEAFDQAPAVAYESADKVICCGQKGIYHKHKAWNQGILAARGEVICLCDSDALFQPNFISSLIKHYRQDETEALPLILLHYQKRTLSTYPGFEKINPDSLESDYNWRVWENTGACLSFRRKDVITYGGLDESKKFLGYFCGPYELAWRLINAGLQEEWIPYSESVLYHFAHPAPVCALGGYSNIRALLEIRNSEINAHAYWAVEAFATGRLLPLQENPKIKQLRLGKRRIGSELELQYSMPEILKNTWKIKYFGKHICRAKFLYYNVRLLIRDYLLGSKLYYFLKWQRDKMLRRTVK